MPPVIPKSRFGKAAAPRHMDARAHCASHPFIHQGCSNIFPCNFVEAVLEYLQINDRKRPQTQQPRNNPAYGA